MKNTQMCTSVYHHHPPSIVSLHFSLVCVLFIILLLRELEWQSALVKFLFFFSSVIWTPRPTRNVPPTTPQLVLALHLPFSKPHWNEQLNPTDVSERPPLKPEVGEGRLIYIGCPSRLVTDEPPSFSARVCRSLRSSKPFTCHSCLMPTDKARYWGVSVLRNWT